jgi:hypothetical protein
MTVGTASAAEPLGGDKAAVVSLVRNAVKAWADNDIATLTAHFSPSSVITDDTPPYFFRAPTAISDWLKAYNADSKAHDVTEPWQTMDEPTEIVVDGPHAYVSFPAVYGFKQHGKPVEIKSTVTVTLEKSDKDWSFVSWTWCKR